MDAPPAPIDLTDEQHVFVQCVREILDAAPGLHHELIYDPRGAEAGRAYAIFDIRTNPAHDLTVALELADQRFVVRLNGVPFVIERGEPRRTERWIHRCCRMVERLVGGDLRLSRRMVLIMEGQVTLAALQNDRWRRVATHRRAILTIFAVLTIPADPTTHTTITEYRAWWRCEPAQTGFRPVGTD